jgi:glycosyltransferase involved in cell wall biosynthesis
MKRIVRVPMESGGRSTGERTLPGTNGGGSESLGAEARRVGVDLSVVVGAYNMARELPRTIRSLSRTMQRGVGDLDYEVIVVDNGSSEPLELREPAGRDVAVRIVRVPPRDASPSPCAALNAALATAGGELVGLMIDGARIASPGMLAAAVSAARTSDRAVVATLGFHLGPKLQMESVRDGYDRVTEDRLLDEVRWSEDGYRLFEIAVPAASCTGDWFAPISESNALFMRRALWDELGGLDPRFVSPGGGFANLDLFARATSLPNAVVVTLVGEATFHQVHGGVATNALVSMQDTYHEEYRRIRGRTYEPPRYRSLFHGHAPPAAARWIASPATAMTTAG